MTDRGRTIFVTATDTGAGKTGVTALLMRHLRTIGVKAAALKPVASGLDGNGSNEDIAGLLEAAGLPATDADAINLYRFAKPAAPSLAAAAQRQCIDPQRLVDWCRQRSCGAQITLIEGIGGLMVPLTPSFLVRDWLAATEDVEVMLVVPARLGAINHALLTLAELARIDLSPRWLVINDIGDDADMCAQTTQALEVHLAAQTTVFKLPYMNPRIMDDPKIHGFATAWLDSLNLGHQGVANERATG